MMRKRRGADRMTLLQNGASQGIGAAADLLQHLIASRFGKSAGNQRELSVCQLSFFGGGHRFRCIRNEKSASRAAIADVKLRLAKLFRLKPLSFPKMPSAGVYFKSQTPPSSARRCGHADASSRSGLASPSTP
jgi:hypothetical protein